VNPTKSRITLWLLFTLGLRIESMSEHAVDSKWQRHRRGGNIWAGPLLLLMRLKPGH